MVMVMRLLLLLLLHSRHLGTQIGTTGCVVCVVGAAQLLTELTDIATNRLMEKRSDSVCKEGRKDPVTLASSVDSRVCVDRLCFLETRPSGLVGSCERNAGISKPLR